MNTILDKVEKASGEVTEVSWDVIECQGFLTI